MKDLSQFSCDATLAIPYPDVCVSGMNSDYATAMLSNVGSANSEMSAVSLYFYNSVLLQPNYAAFAHCFHHISIVEMHHLDIFAQLSYQLGEDPRLWCRAKNRKMVYWTPSYNDYPCEIKEVILNSIQAEKGAIQKYKRQAAVIRDEHIVKLLQRIILDEEHHLVLFSRMLALL